MRGRASQLESPAQQNTTKRTLRLKKRQLAAPATDVGGAAVVVVAERAAVENSPLEEEKKWFAAQLRKRLLRTRAALQVTGNTVLDDDTALEEISWLASLDEVLDALGEASEMFMAMFSEEKLVQLKASQESIAKGKVRALRLKRHQSRVAETCDSAVVDLTAEAEENDSEVVSSLLDASRSFAERIDLAWKKKDEAVVVLQQQQQQRVRRPSKKREQAEQEKDEEEEEEKDEDEEEEEEVATAAKKKRNNKRQPSREEEGEEEEEGEDEDELMEKAHQNNDIVLALLEKAERDVALVHTMLAEATQNSLVLKLGNVATLNSNLASVAKGAALALNKEGLLRCLREQDSDADVDVDQLQIERWGVLLRWRRIVNRAFEIRGLFNFLRSDQSKGGKKMPNRYKFAIKDFDEGEVFSFVQAARYDRLGKFLLQYPRFADQMQLVSMSDWIQKVVVSRRGRDVVLLDALESLLSEEKIKFWKQPVFAVPVEEVCVVCAQSRARARLWNCPECGTLFHEMCAGYDGSTACDDVQVHIYCHKCLSKHAMTPDDVAAQVVEIKKVASYLMSDGCPFVLERLADSGAALFQMLEKCARVHLGFKGTTAEFCRRVAQAAESDSDALKRMAAEKSKPGKLFAEKNTVWDVEHVLAGFCKLFNECVKANIFAVSGRAVEKVRSFGTQGSAVEVNMLRWVTTKHYDCLEKRE